LLPQLASTIKLKKVKNIVKKLSKYVKICQKGVKSCQKVFPKVVKKLSKSCQKVVKKEFGPKFVQNLSIINPFVRRRRRRKRRLLALRPGGDFVAPGKKG
jgi:hypothetical protein